MIQFKVPSLKVPLPKERVDIVGEPLTRGALNPIVNGKTKVCYICRKTKPLEDFSLHASRADGRQTYCKLCGREQQAKWYYKRKHGLTLDERDALLEAQKGVCAICKKPTKFKEKIGRSNNTGDEAVVDHCHTTLKIRGVLCGHCNTALGAFKDNIDSLNSAIEYLKTSGVYLTSTP